MRRYIIRLLGSAFSVFTSIFVGARADAPGVPWDDGMVHTNGNNKYKINIVIGNPWYVGWQSRNQGTRSPEYDAKWSEIFTDHIIGHHKQGHVKWGLMSGKTNATYTGTLISPRTFSVGRGAAATGTRFGDAKGEQLWLHQTAGMYSLYYTQTASPFIQAQCCEYSGKTMLGNALAFTYSGNGESPSVCPCYYMKANTTYSGDVSCERDIKCTGTSYEGLDNNTFYPAVIHDVYFCYQYTGCATETYPSFDDMAANSPATGFCYLVRNPLIGNKGVIDRGGDTVNDIEKDIDNDGFFDPVLDYDFSCEWPNGGRLYYSCPSGAYRGFLGNGPDGCYTCPSVYGTKVGNYTLTNTKVGIVDGVNGIGACRFSQPMSSDNSGQFELTTSVGTAQTCSGT